jgi:hypothetical protein
MGKLINPPRIMQEQQSFIVVYNASLELVRTTVLGNPYKLEPQSFTRLPIAARQMIVSRLEPWGIFEVYDEIDPKKNPAMFEQAKLEALSVYAGSLHRRLANYESFRKEKLLSGVKIPLFKAEKLAKAWLQEIETLIGKSEHKELAPSFLNKDGIDLDEKQNVTNEPKADKELDELNTLVEPALKADSLNEEVAEIFEPLDAIDPHDVPVAESNEALAS